MWLLQIQYLYYDFIRVDLTRSISISNYGYVTDNFKAEYEIFNDKFSPWNPDVDSTKYVHQTLDLLTYEQKYLRLMLVRHCTPERSNENYCDYFIPAQKQRAKKSSYLFKERIPFRK